MAKFAANGKDYHAQNQGHLVGELVKRVIQKPLKEFIAGDICRPFYAVFQLGALENYWNRVSDLIPPEAAFNKDALVALGTDSSACKAMTRPFSTSAAALTAE